MTSLTDTQIINASGGLVELGYSAITTPGTVTSTTAGTGTQIISPLTVVCDGSPILVEFRAPVTTAPPSGTVNISLYQDGTENIRQWGQQSSETFAQQKVPTFIQTRLTPSAGVHTFGVYGYNSSGTSVIQAGSGGSTTAAPAYLRISKIVQAAQWPAVTTGTIVCTSTTRPSSPFAGQQIYEADTVENYIWNGSVWASSQTVSKPPMCINERTGQSISDSVTTAIAFTSAASVDTETPTTIHSTSTNNTRFTARTAGVYQFYGSVVNTSVATIDVTGGIALRKNGTTEFANSSIVSNAYTQNASVSALVSLAVGDYVELTVYQDNTANQARTFTGRMQCALVGQAS
jgi:hypothetical protein